MTRYIALLRAINVGGRTIKMEVLRQHFEALGLTKVETFINSGNVIFETRAAKNSSLEKKIEAQLRQMMGYEVSAFVRTEPELAAVAAYQPPFPPTPPEGALYIAFIQAPLSAPVLQALAAADTATDKFHAHHCEVYWWRAGRYSDSPLSASGRFEKLLGVPTTVRKSTTVRSLAEKYPVKE